MSMTKREMTIFENLFETTQDITKTANSRHAAAIVRKGVVYGLGVNSYKTDPAQRRFSGPKRTCIHAEMAAIKRASAALRTNDLSNYTLMVVRSKHDGEDVIYGNSKPCNGCQKAIEEYNIRKVIYSVDGGYTVERTFKD